MSKVFEHYKEENKFRYIPKFTKAGDQRLDKSKLIDLLLKHQDHSGIDRLWV